MKLIGSKRAIRSPEFHKQMEFRRKLRFGVMSLLFVVLLLSPIFVLRSQKLLLSKIEVSGNSVTSSEEVERVVKESLLGKYLWLIPKSSFALYPEDSIVEELEREFPRFSSVSLSLSGLTSLEVEVVERGPEALYCKSGGECFFVDKTGLIYADAPTFSEGVYTVYKKESDLEDPLRQYILSESEIVKNKNFLTALTTLGFTPDTLLIKDDEYVLKTKDGPRVLWRKMQDFDRLARDFNAFLKSAKVKKESFKDVLYFDLRVDNKIFYKYIGE